jgi:hypothetical protein
MNEAQKKMNWSILYFIGSYGLFYVIALLYRKFLPEYTIHFWIAELNKQVEFTMQIAEICDVVLLGILFSVNCFHTYNLLEERQKKKIMRLRYYFIISIIILNFGVITHMVANQLHEYIYKLEDEGVIIAAGSTLENLALGLYFWDEVISHILSGIGFFLLLILFIRMERTGQNIGDFSSKLTFLMSFFVGIGVAAGLIEGQCGYIFFIVAIVLLIFIPVHMIGQKYITKPFNAATLFMLIGYVIFTLIYVYLTGLKPNYPYIKQLSEIGSFFF